MNAGKAVGAESSGVEHRYGGPWTEIKLDAVEYYLTCYTRALKRAGFDITYIDPFAGTGSRDVERRVSGGLLGEPEVFVTENLAGSARRALNVKPQFDHLIFIEKAPTRCVALNELKHINLHRDIEVIPGEANNELKKLVQREPWCRKDASKSRGVVFLDPYALDVEWSTLQALASTRVLDVWYLFPIRDTIRQLAHNFEGIGPKKPTLDRFLPPGWSNELYAIAPDHQRTSLFDEQIEPELRRVVSRSQFEDWLRRRLLDEFEFVSEPLPILTTQQRQAFSLFLAVSNPSRPAIELAEKFVRHVNKKFSPWASRRSADR
jgi:three-Cys-motif partner protein